MCSDHFIAGKPSSDPSHPDYVPNQHVPSKRSTEDRTVIDTDDVDDADDDALSPSSRRGLSRYVRAQKRRSAADKWSLEAAKRTHLEEEEHRRREERKLQESRRFLCSWDHGHALKAWFPEEAPVRKEQGENRTTDTVTTVATLKLWEDYKLFQMRQ